MARDINQLHPQAKTLAQKLVSECAAQGLVIKITDCVRNKAEQDALYAQGRTTAGNKVTNVVYPNSMHNWGIAFDICRNDGKGAYYDDDGFFKKVGAIGKQLGLEWGGDWTSPVDKPHFQLSGWGSTPKKLKATYGTPEAYRKTWGGSDTSGNTSGSTSSTAGASTGNVKISVDGSWGPATTRKAQKVFGTTCDGVISNQPMTNKKYLPNASTSTWQFKHSGYRGGSSLIKAIQRRIGASVDGYFGPGSVKALQKFLGISQDGSMGPATVKAFQTWLNNY